MKKLMTFLRTTGGFVLSIAISAAAIVWSLILGKTTRELVDVSKIIDGIEYTNNNVRVFADDGHPWWYLMTAAGIILFFVTMAANNLLDD